MCNFEQICELLNRGIISRKGGDIAKTSLAPLKYAIGNGIYMGCPGKEIYYSLPTLTSNEKIEIITRVMNAFPEGTGRSVHLSLFWRYFYGMFDKWGCLNDRINVLSKYRSYPVKWDLYFEFVEQFLSVAKLKNKYAYIIASEMYAHRLGDQCLLNQDNKCLDKMIEMYNNAMTVSVQVSSDKNSFSAPYWCCCYLFKMGKVDQAYEYGWLFLENCNKYCHSKGVYNKMLSAVGILYQISTPEQWEKINQRCDRFNNPLAHKMWKKAFENKLSWHL